MNKVVLIGRLTKDPELRFTPGTGTAVASFTLAVNRDFKNSSGEYDADFIPIIVWNKRAETVANNLNKGRLVAVSGRIQTRSYDAKDGTRRYVTEIVADNVQFLDYAKNGQGQGNNETPPPVDNEITPIDDGDIPF